MLLHILRVALFECHATFRRVKIAPVVPENLGILRGGSLDGVSGQLKNKYPDALAARAGRESWCVR